MLMSGQAPHNPAPRSSASSRSRSYSRQVLVGEGFRSCGPTRAHEVLVELVCWSNFVVVRVQELLGHVLHSS